MNEAYLFTVARRAGCPPMWLEDCAQECRLAMWRAPDAPWKTVVQRESVDFMRRLQGRTEDQIRRRSTVALDGIDFYRAYEQDIDAHVDAQRLLAKVMAVLTPGQRAAFLDDRLLRDGCESDRRGALRWQGRQRLRGLA